MGTAEPAGGDARSTLRSALRPYVRASILFGLAYNLLLLIAPLYMLQVYDRVLTSGSVDTLLLLTTLAVAMYGIYAAADAGRKRVFALMAARTGQVLEGEIFERGMTPAGSGKRFEGAVQDLSRVQAFFSTGAAQMLFDMPFVPMFVLLVFLVHPLLGCITLIGAVVLALLAWATEHATKERLEDAGKREQAASAFLGGISRAYGVVTAMGMSARVLTRWRALRADASGAALAAGGTANVYGGISRSIRQVLQTLILGLAAWLVLKQEISAGAIIASSILSGRALGPIDQAIAMWKPALRARRGWTDLLAYLSDVPRHDAVTALPTPEARVVLDAMAVQIPGAPAALLPAMTFALQPGHIVLVLGPSGQGKSALLQTLAGAWQPGGGTVSLGGRDLHAWAALDRGRHVGYLPQHTDLLPGTVRQNIERFSDGSDEAVIAAAQAVGAHPAIISLPDGYDTPVMAAGPISMGQRQLIGLARANYGSPPLMLLDEPSASLDQRAVASLMELLNACRKDRRTVIVATHDHRLLGVADLILLLEKPRPRLLPRDEFLRAMNSGRSQPQPIAVAP